MITLSLNDTDFLAKICTLVSEYKEEPLIKFSPSGLNFLTNSSDNTTFLEVFVSNNYFSEYPVSKEFFVKLPLTHFITALKSCQKNSQMKISFDDTFSTVSISSIGKNEKSYKLRLLDYSGPDTLVKIPPVNPKSSITTSMTEFCNLFDSVINFSKKRDGYSKIMFSLTNRWLDIKSEDKIIGDSLVKVYSSDITIITMRTEKTKTETNEEIDIPIKLERAQYNRSFLDSFISKAKLLHDKLTISFETDFPMEIKIKKQDTFLRFLIAPTIDDDSSR